MARTVRAAPIPASSNGHVAPSRSDGARSVVSLAAPRRRRPSWVLFGVVLVGVAALLGAWVFTATSQRMSVVVAAHDVAPGDVISGSDLRVVEMGRAGGLRAILSSQQSLIVGRAARGPIPAGTVLNTGLFADRDGVIPAGQVVVGAALEPGAAPVAHLAPGDRVDVLGVVKSTGTPTAAASLLTSGSVWSVGPATSGSASARVWVALLIPADAQATVAQAAADGRLRLSLVGAGG